MRLPDVVGIGTRRCGSSWLHHVLNNHPRIGKPPNGLHFFSTNFDRGLPWYLEQLQPYSDRPVLMEFSVSYLYPEHCERSSQRILELVPAAKLFVCLRDPVERAWSDYLRSLRNAELPHATSFADALKLQPELIERGRYGRLLRPFFDRFGRDRIKILLYEDLQRDEKAYLSSLLDFMGIGGAIDPRWFDRSEPVGKGVRWPALDAALRRVKASADGTAAKLGLEDAWSNLKARYVFTYEKVLEINRREVSMPLSVATSLREVFSEDIRALAAMTGCNVEHWHAR